MAKRKIRKKTTKSSTGKTQTVLLPEKRYSLTFAFWLVVLVLGVTFLGGWLFWNWYIIGTQQVPIVVAVTHDNVLGFNAATDKLYFGTIAPGGHAERWTHLDTSVDAVAVIRMEGDVADWMSVTRNNVRVAANQREDIIIRVTAPDDTPVGNYTGAAVITFHKPMPWE